MKIEKFTISRNDTFMEGCLTLSASEFKGTSANLKACIFTEAELTKSERFETYLIDTDNAAPPTRGFGVGTA